MTIDELIESLKQLKAKHGGETRVVCQTLSHIFPPEPTVRQAMSGKVILLNP